MKRIRHGTGKRKPIKDYHRKRYGNPLFGGAGRKGPRSRKAKGDTTPILKRILVVIGSMLVLGVLGYVAWGPTFGITSVEIDGATPLTEQRIRELVTERLEKNALLIFPQSTVFFLDTGNLRKDVEDEFFLDEMTIEKRLPGTVIITIREIPKRAVLFGDNRFLAISESGSVIRELTEKEVQRMTDLPDDIASVLVTGLGAEMVELDTLTTTDSRDDAPAVRNGNEHPLVFDDEHDDDPFEKEFRPGDTAISASTLRLVLDANVRLPDIVGAAVRWFNVREKDETVDITLDGDWHIYLTTALPFDVQSERLALVLRERIGSDRSRLQYVDLRYNERIFFKLRDIQEE